MFENAKWIGKDTSKHDGSWLLRKEIILNDIPSSATLNIIMLGYGVATINGRLVTDDVLTTPATAFDKKVYYNSYDVTHMLTIGENVLGAFIGNGLYNDTAAAWDFQFAPWRHHPKMIAQLDVEFENGEKQSFCSNSSWKLTNGPCIYNHSREGETYDARLEIPNWDCPNFDASAWENATVCRSPGGKIELNTMPNPKVIKTIEPTYIGNGIYDFGGNHSGWVRIYTTCEAGKEIKMEYAELLKDGDLDQYINTFLIRDGSPHINYDMYITSGRGEETYAPRFCYHGFRYVKVTGAPKNFRIVAERVYTDLKTIGSFECSNEMLNKIHNASVNATLTNYMSIPTDCPHREQNGWTGDAVLSCQQALMNFDMLSAYSKWIQDLVDAQRPSGQLPGIYPTGGWGFNWGSGPAWDAALILMPWQIYQSTGKTEIIKNSWSAIKLYMQFMSTMAENYLVDFGLGDWEPPENCNLCPTVITDTALYYSFALTAAKYAEIMGEASAEYLELAEEIKKAFRANFFGDKDLEGKQTYLACIIYQGLCKPNEVSKYAAMLNDLIIENNYHFDCGILGTKYIFSALSDNGYADTVLKAVINPTKPSYAYWINAGFDTLCENWELKESCNHHMYSEVDHWLYRHIAGIRIDENGIEIRPCFVVDWVKARHKDIEVSWDNKKIYINLPCEAKLNLNGKIYNLNKGYNEIIR